jgi:hypothetical protein
MNEQQLLAATKNASVSARGMAPPGDEETESLHQAYLSLGELLDRRTIEVNEHWLVNAILQEHPRGGAAQQPARSEAWLAMAALAASLLLMVSLAAIQFRDSGQRLAVVATAPAASNAAADLNASDDAQLAWENDAWDSRLEEVREFATAYRSGGFLRFESTAWSASQARQEVEAELDTM